jgi:metal-responsive CopG/Arc/MetJ family transcriptional regulator
VARERINVSMTEEGLAILDHERDKMGLSRSAMFEVLIRTWARDQQLLEAGTGRDRAAVGTVATKKSRRRSAAKASR